MSRQEMVDTLRALPGQIEALVRDLDEEALCWRPTPDQWSIKEVCAHLRDSLEIDGERIRRMLEEDEPLSPLTTRRPWPASATTRTRACPWS